jgi:hypothetical protein
METLVRMREEEMVNTGDPFVSSYDTNMVMALMPFAYSSLNIIMSE